MRKLKFPLTFGFDCAILLKLSKMKSVFERIRGCSSAGSAPRSQRGGLGLFLRIHSFPESRQYFGSPTNASLQFSRRTALSTAVDENHVCPAIAWIVEFQNSPPTSFPMPPAGPAGPSHRDIAVLTFLSFFSFFFSIFLKNEKPVRSGPGLITKKNTESGGVAQLGERRVRNAEV